MNIAVKKIDINELDIIIHVTASQFSGYCDVISNRLWRHPHNVQRTNATRWRHVKIVILSSFMDSLCCVRNTIMYVLSWRTVYALTRVLWWCLIPSLLLNSGNKHQNTLLWSHKQFDTRVHTLFYIINGTLGVLIQRGWLLLFAAKSFQIWHHRRHCLLNINLGLGLP